MTAIGSWVRLRRLRTFSLRTGLLLFLLCGAAMGLFARWYHQVRERGEAQLRIIQSRPSHTRGEPLLGAQYSPRDKPTWLTSLIRKGVHPEYNRPIALLHYDGISIDDARARDIGSLFSVETFDLDCNSLSPQTAARLFEIKGLRELGVSDHHGGAGWSDETFQQLGMAKTLQSFHAVNSFLSDKTCHVVSALPELIELHVGACTPEGVAILATSKKLQKLNIRSLRHSASDFRNAQQAEGKFRERARLAMKKALKALEQNQAFSYLSIDGPLGLTPDDLKEFCQTSKLKTLHLRQPEISPECLAEFAKLPNLESFTYYDLTLRNEHLAPLANAKKLKFLCIGPNLSGDAILALREQLPGCKICMY